MNAELFDAIRAVQSMPIGVFLARLRTEHGMTQEELAKLAGVSRPYVTQIENGTKSPTREMVQRLLSALMVTPEQMAIALGDITADDLVRAQRLAGAVLRLQSFVPDDEWAEITEVLGDLNGVVGLADKFTGAAHPERPTLTDAVLPGWEDLTPDNRRVIKELVAQLAAANTGGENDAD